MSYVSGNVFNFENRLHQLGVSQQDLQSFLTEGNNLTTSVQNLKKWNKEFAKRWWNSTGSLQYFVNEQAFGSEQIGALLYENDELQFEVNTLTYNL